jgi:hypothetical protein
MIKAAKNCLRRLLYALLHGCRTKAPERVRNFLSPSMFYLQSEVF